MKTPGVESASVNLATERVVVRYLPGIAAHDDLAKAAEKAGYSVRGRQPTGDETDAEAIEAARERREFNILKLKIAASLMFWPVWLLGDRPYDEMEDLFLPFLWECRRPGATAPS